MSYDLAIRGGTLYDGSGSPGRPGDVGVRGGRIVEVGELSETARETIDAAGLAVAPGFIDVHTHYDAQVFWDRNLTISPWHGVTTVVMGNCGFGVAPTRPEHRELILRTLEKVEGMSLAALEAGVGHDWPFETFPEYLDAIEARGTAIHVAALVGHTPVRTYVMGKDATERAATSEEMTRMKALVDEALTAGAIGFATSKAPTHVGYEGRPVPSRLAEMDEIELLAGAVRDAGRGVVQATAGPGFFVSELGELAEKLGRPLTWTALLAGLLGPGSHRWILDQNVELQKRGVELVPQVSCRPLVFEFQMAEPFVFESMPLFGKVSAADGDGKRRLYGDPEFREAFRRDTSAAGGGVFRVRWHEMEIVECSAEPELEGRMVAEVARERSAEPADLLLDLSLASDLRSRFRVPLLNTDETEVGELLSDPHTILGLSDAGAHASQLCDACFSTHLLGHWVRELEVLSLEQAVRMLTSRAAEVFGLEGRGRIAPGAHADLVVFDPATVGAGPLRRVRDQPANADRLVSDASGIDVVVVEGTIVRRDGSDALDPEGPLPGRVLRGGTSE